MPECQRSSEAALRVVDGSVQRPGVDVIQAGAIVPAIVRRGISEPHELGEELLRLLPVGDAGEPRVLAWNADARVQHHRHEEPSLTVRKTQAWPLPRCVPGTSSQQLLGETWPAAADRRHRVLRNSLSRALPPRWQAKPELDFAAACRLDSAA